MFMDSMICCMKVRLISSVSKQSFLLNDNIFSSLAISAAVLFRFWMRTPGLGRRANVSVGAMRLYS